MQFTLNVNGKSEKVDVEPETPLLWVLRDNIGLTGTKYGCGIARCGVCTIQVDGQAMKASQLPASAAVTKRKEILLRIAPDLWEEVARWAADELRSVNGHIEFLLREAVREKRHGSGRARENPNRPEE